MRNILICNFLLLLIVSSANSQTNYDYYTYRLHYNKAKFAAAEKKYQEACSNYKEAFKYGNQNLPDNSHLEEYASCLLASGDTLNSIEAVKKAIVKGCNIEYMSIAEKFSKKHLDQLKNEYPVLRLKYWNNKIGDIENIIELSKLDAVDQAVRNNFLDKVPRNIFNRLYEITDSVNFIQLKQLVIEKGANPAGMLMLHLYGDNQKYFTFYDSIFKGEIFEGKISPEFYVFWFDRQRIYVEGKTTQLYGQYNFYDRGEKDYSPDKNLIEDIENIDKRRAEIGLMSLEDWALVQNGTLPEEYKKMKVKTKSKK